MTDSREQENGPPVDSAAFREWVTHTAESRGIDEQELLNQLVSAFWVLDEMNGLMGDEDPFSSAKNAEMGGKLTDDVENESVRSPGVEEPDKIAEDRTPDARRGSESQSEQSGDDTEPAVDADVLKEEVNTLQKSLHTQLEMVQAIGDLRRQVSDLSLDIEQQRTKHDQFSDQISETISRLESRIQTLDTQSTEGLEEEVVEQRLADVRTDIEQLQATQDEFETWIDEEFDQIEGLFERLIEADAEIEHRLDDVESELESRSDVIADRDQLVNLRLTALRSGITKGVCDSCGVTIDLSMLDQPICPDCGAELVDIETETTGWNPFAKPTLQTEPSNQNRFNSP